MRCGTSSRHAVDQQSYVEVEAAASRRVAHRITFVAVVPFIVGQENVAGIFRDDVFRPAEDEGIH